MAWLHDGRGQRPDRGRDVAPDNDNGFSEMNYSTIQKNTLDGLSESAGVLYLKLCDVFCGDERRAFLEACRYEDRVARVLGYILRRAPLTIDDRTRTDLSTFFAERWRNNFMKG